MEKPNLTLTQGDCLKEMPRIKSQSVNLILADLPYGITSANWDKIIPFSELWSEYARVIKPNGVVALTASQPFTSKLVMSKFDWFKYELIWFKNTCTGFVNAKYIPLKAHENILIFSPAAVRSTRPDHPKMTYNPQGLKPYGKTIKGRHRGGALLNSNLDKAYVREFTNYPKSVLQIDSETKRIHPTQKPLPLMKYLVQTYSNPGDMVLDNVMGSGTTGVAAVETGRSFIGIEKDTTFYNAACQRILLHTMWKTPGAAE